eukprot:1503771-Amphidinium_carterae.1
MLKLVVPCREGFGGDQNAPALVRTTSLGWNLVQPHLPPVLDEALPRELDGHLLDRVRGETATQGAFPAIHFVILHAARCELVSWKLDSEASLRLSRHSLRSE